MRVLQLCHKAPFPSTDGGAMAIRSLTEGLLHKGVDLRLLSIETYKHPFDLEAFPAWVREKAHPKGVFVETKLDPVDAFSSLVNRDPYNVSRFFSPDLDSELIRTLEEFQPEVVQLESLFMAPYIDTIRKFSTAKVVLRSHNLEHRIWEKVAEGTGHLLKKAYLRLLSQQLRKYERSVLHAIDGLVSISHEDQRKFQDMGLEVPSVCIPYGLDTEKWAPDPSIPHPEGPRFFHLGSMDWIPNQDAVDHLLENIWPKVREEFPEAELRLIGKNMDRDQDEVPEGVVVVGEVENVMQVIREEGIMLVPLLSGSGIRVRIIQGMAMEKAIVTTPIGISGIQATDGREVMIAEGTEGFAEKMIELGRDPDRCRKLGRAAREKVIREYDEGRLLDRLLTFYRELPECVS